MTYTLIDVPSGTVIHTETYQSAMRVRKETDTGVIIRDDAPVYTPLVIAARNHMNQSNQY